MAAASSGRTRPTRIENPIRLDQPASSRDDRRAADGLARDVRPDAQEPGPRGGHLRRHAGFPGGRSRRGHPLRGAAQRRDRGACRWSRGRTWRARRSGSARLPAATWAAMTTATSNGSVNSMHDSLNPLAGMVPMSNDDAQRGLQRHRRRFREHADVHHRRRVPRRLDGRPDAGIPGQEGRGQGGQAGHDRHPDPSLADPGRGTGLFAATDWGAKTTANPARTASPRSSTSSPRRPPTTVRASKGWATTRPPGTSPRASSSCWAGSRLIFCRWPWRVPGRRRSASPRPLGHCRPTT